MSDEKVVITLGGQSWTVEPPPFGALMRLQPRYLNFTEKLATHAGQVPTSPELMGELCDIVRGIISAGSDAEVDAAEFLKLRFSLTDLIGAFENLAHVIGIRRIAPGESQPAAQASPAKGKRSTGKS